MFYGVHLTSERAMLLLESMFYYNKHGWHFICLLFSSLTIKAFPKIHTHRKLYNLEQIVIFNLTDRILFLSTVSLANPLMTHFQLVTLFLSLGRLLFAQIKCIISEMSHPTLQRKQLSELGNKEAETVMCVTFNL